MSHKGDSELGHPLMIEILKIEKLERLVEDDVETVLGVKFERDERRSNPYFEFFVGYPSDGISDLKVIDHVDFRKPRSLASGRGPLLTIHLVTTAKISSREAAEILGQPADITVPEPSMGNPVRVYHSYEITQGKISFGIGEDDTIVSVVIDRTKR